MYRIILLPQIGVSIDGIGQVNFGDTREKLVEVLGPYLSIQSENDKRVEYKKYGFFAGFKKDDDTFEAVEFWNAHQENVSEVFIYDREVLQANATEIKGMLIDKNRKEAAKDGWFVHIDVLYSGGNPNSVLSIIEQYKAAGTYEQMKAHLLKDVEKANCFTTFGIGYNGYCKDGLAMLEKILNG
jgi:hypothetical protein